MSPHTVAATIIPNSGAIQVFTVTNTGGSQATYTLTPVCSGAGVASCSTHPASLTLAASASKPDTVLFATQASGTTGTVTLQVKIGATVLDQGTLTVSVAADSVTPDGQAVTQPPSVPASQVFSVKNTGTGQTLFFLTPVCSGAGVSASCSASPNTLDLAAGATGTTTVNYSTLTAPNSGKVLLKADFNGVVLDTGWVNVTVSSGSVAALVAPHTVAATIIPSSGAIQVFTVTNTGTVTTIYALTPVCSGAGVASCSTHPASLTLAASASNPDTVLFATQGAGTTGTVTLQAKAGTTLLDQGVLTVSVAGDSVTPDGQAVTQPPNSPASQVFSIKNTGTGQTLYNLTPVCSGAGLSASCSVSPTTLNLAGGVTSTATVNYSTLAAPSTGKVVLKAAFNGVVLDTGWVNVTVSLGSVTALVLPHGGTATPPPNSPATQLFTVQNTSGTAQTFSLVPSCTGTGVVTAPACTVTPATTGSLAPQATLNATINYSTLASGTGSLILQAKQGSTVVDGGSVTVTVSSTPPITALVLPHGGTATQPPNSPATQLFIVKNTSGTPQTFSLVPSCTGSGVVTAPACTVTPTTTGSLLSQATINATINYSTLASGTGSLILQAKQGSTVVDTGSVTVTVSSSGQVAPVISLAGLNSGATIPRDECLTISLGGGTASECGDLRIVHGLPAVRTMNVTRAPVLLYNSAQAEPTPNVAVAVTMPLGATLPDTVEVLLKIGTVVYGRRVFPGSQWTTLGAPRVVRVRDTLTSTSASQLLTYTVEVANLYNPPAANRLPVASTQEVMIVNRRTSPYGKGWWLAGLEQLDVSTMVWIGGDGSTRHYLPAGTGKWASETVDRPDTLRLIAGQYVRYLPDSLKVIFDVTGKHIQTINRLKQVTQFKYVGGLLDSLVVPVRGTSRGYKLTYNTGTVQIREGLGVSPRVATLYVTSGRLDSIADPDAGRVRFGYQSASSGVITSRTDRMSVVRTFTVDSLRKVTRAFISPGVGLGPIIDSIRPWQSVGYAASVDTARAYTWWDGPRTNVVDTTTFRLTRWSAPRTIVNALGQVTKIERTDSIAFPAFITRTVAANTWVMKQTHDAMGRTLTVTDSGAVVRGDTIPVTTTYQWHQGCDLVSQVTPPEGLAVTFAYDANTCNLLSETDGAGHQTTYTYHSFFLPATVQRPGITGVDSMRYDTDMGNLQVTRTPLLFLTTHITDGFGRDSIVRSQMDPVDTSVVLSHTFTYDVMGRLTQDTTSGSSRTYFSTIAGTNLVSPAMTVSKSNAYDPEGRLTSAFAEELANGVETLQSWNYDAAGRDTLTKLASAATRTQYDEAGNVILTQKGGSTIPAVVISYDVLNRPIKRVVPSRDYTQACAPSAQCWKSAPIYPNNGTGLTIASDTVSMTYDNVGHLLSASNRWARILRSYHLNGWLQSDTTTYASPFGPGFGYTGQPKYELGFRYDANGRRVSLYHPVLLAPSVNLQSYTYDPATGALQSTVDLLGNTYSYQDDAAGRLRFIETTTSGGVNGVEQEWRYDNDSRVAKRFFRTRSGGTLSSLAGEDTLTYDAQGRILQATTYGPASPMTSPFTMKYDGMGGLLTSATSYLASARTEEYQRDGLGNSLWEGTTGEAGFPVPYTSNYMANGRLRRRDGVAPTPPVDCRSAYPDSLVQTYDALGNLSKRFRAIYTGGFAGCSVSYNEMDAEFYWFDADNRIMVVQRDAGTPDRFTRTGTWEEYHYDPFGRRIHVRERRDSLAAGTNLESAITTVVWDGNQMLYEQRDRDGLGGPARRYGLVGYIHGRELDAPLAYTDGTMPVPDWRGLYQGSVLTSGPGADCATGGGGNPCLSINWPAGNVAMSFRGWAGGQGATLDTWKGSLTTSMRDGTGLMYRRNRYYDPLTGRFTQLDPIGLAGGSNGYGFGNGDPVNFADPFGLDVTFGKEIAGALKQLFARSPTALRIYNALNGNHNAHLIITGCSTGCPGDVQMSGGGFFSGNIFAQRIWVDDNKYSGDDLLERLGHELVEAGQGIDARGTGISCNKGEERHDCTIRHENIIRSEAHMPKREKDEKEKKPEERL